MSLLSVAPNSLTGMLTIPKLMDPLQIALAILISSGAWGARWLRRSGISTLETPANGVINIPALLSTCLSTQLVDK
jgi:hypothetical protein